MKKLILGIFILFTLFIFTAIAFADGISSNQIFSFKQVNTSTNATLKVGCYGNKHVVLGSDRLIYYSDDGENWNEKVIDEKMDLSKGYGDILYNNSEYLMVGYNGRDIYKSADAASWTKVSVQWADNDSRICSVVYANNKYVAVGEKDEIVSGVDASVIYTSIDGTKWTKQNVKIGESFDSGNRQLYFNKVIYANGKFLAVGSCGLIYTSTNGTDWTKQEIESTSDILTAVADSEYYYIFTNNSKVLKSKDAITWESFDLSNQFISVVYDDGAIVACDIENKIYSSVDGVEWVRNFSDDTTKAVYSVFKGKDSFFVVGQSGLLLKSTKTELKSEEISVFLDGEKIEFDVNPIIIDGRTMVPLRKIFEALGAEISWNDETKTVTSNKGKSKVIISIDSTNAYVNGELKVLDVPAKIIDGRTMVPLRFVSEAMLAKVDWISNIKSINIESLKNPFENIKRGVAYFDYIGNYKIGAIGYYWYLSIYQGLPVNLDVYDPMTLKKNSYIINPRVPNDEWREDKVVKDLGLEWEIITMINKLISDFNSR